MKYRKNVIIFALLLVAGAMAGCSGKKTRDFFAAGGITVGAPVALTPGVYQIPIKFDTAIVHSGEWLDVVSVKVTGSDLLVTASFTIAHRKSAYPGCVEVKGVSPGLYTLKYRDPDGTQHTIGPVNLP
jgi:hypothetical protein